MLHNTDDTGKSRLEIDAGSPPPCASYQETLLHEFRTHLAGEDELFSHGIELYTNLYVRIFPQPHRDTRYFSSNE